MTQDENLDEILLIDFLRSRLDDEQAAAVRKRLEEEPDLRALKANLENTFAALNCAPQPQVPDDLLEKTLSRIATVRRTNAILSLQQLDAPRRFRPTFSMKELVAVAAVVLIAVAISIPSLQLAKRRGERGLCAAQLGQIGNALQSFAGDNDDYMPGTNATTDYWLDRNGKECASNSAGLFKLLKNDYHVSPVTFQCPSVGGASFTVAPEMADFPKPEHIQYSYQHSLQRGPNTREGRYSEMVILADQSPWFQNGYDKSSAEEDCSENHRGCGQNVLYLDGHSSWATSPQTGVEQDNIYTIANNPDSYTGNETPANKTDTFLLPAWTRR
ncbi:MAG: hypothetical protein KAR11_01550 [Phycisphaerae bacterium]|nr:hypothetical protein [Phycisphaerae bacterium]